MPPTGLILYALIELQSPFNQPFVNMFKNVLLTFYVHDTLKCDTCPTILAHDLAYVPAILRLNQKRE